MVDVVILIVIGLCLFMGAKRGLVLSLISVLSLVIALVVGYLLMPVVGGVLQKTSLPDATEKAVYTSISETLSSGEEELDYKGALEKSALPEFIKDKVEDAIEDSDTSQTVDSISHAAAKSVAGVVVKAIAVLSVAVIVFIILTSVKSLWKGIRKISVIRKLDTVGGVVFGLGQSVLIICAFMLLLGLLSANDFSHGLVSQVQQSFLGAFFYEHNFLGLLVALFVK